MKNHDSSAMDSILILAHAELNDFYWLSNYYLLIKDKNRLKIHGFAIKLKIGIKSALLNS